MQFMFDPKRTFCEPRTQRGLASRVFLDQSNRRRSTLLLSAAAFVGAVIIWASVLWVVLLSNGDLEAALPDEIMVLKGRLLKSEETVSGLSMSVEDPLSAIEIHRQQEAAKYQCQPPRIANGKPAELSPHRKVYAVLPIELPSSIASLYKSCDAVHVVMPTWYAAEVLNGVLQVVGVDEETKNQLRDYQKESRSDVSIMPIITLDLGSARQLVDDRLLNEPALAFSKLFDVTGTDGGNDGYCLDAAGLISSGASDFADIARFFSEKLRHQKLVSCVILPSAAPEHILIVANKFFDTVVAKAYLEPWVGSATEPLAAKTWFQAHVASLQNHISPEKLVVLLGTHAVDWVSGRPKPVVAPFAQVVSALADVGTAPEFVDVRGNTRATYIDDTGLQHRIWMLDAASLHNQMLMLHKMNIVSFGLAKLGYEDPGTWAVLDQAQNGVELTSGSLAIVVFSDYVEHRGQGPFVSPISMPSVGQRTTMTDPKTNFVISVHYEKTPRASVARLYGAGKPNKVVLTFDDGPDPKYTGDTLDILQATNTPAAFFVLGANAIKSPALLKRILAEGHEIGSHTYRHPKMGEISAARAAMEVNSVQLLVNGITGKSMRLYREPYMRGGGPVTSKEIASLMPLEESGYIIAGMDIVPRDWLVQSADQLANEIITRVEQNAGGIVLLHDGGEDQSQTVAALPQVINTLRDKGYEFTTIAEFLDTTSDVLMPDSDKVTSTFGNVSFLAVGNSWSVLEFIFWTVFGIGLFRAIMLLILTAKRTRHVPSQSGDLPSVTIVIPAYNEEKVIGKCISRALATRYTDYDIIVVNDGSSDGTYSEAMAFADHPLVTVISQPNGGKASALNAALDETESEVLICIDADSQISPNAVGLLVAHFEDPKVGAVAGRVIVGNRHSILTRLQALEYITAQSIERRAKEYLNAITVVPGAIGAWRTTAIMEAGIFSTETLTEDADMTMAIIRSDYRVVYEEHAFATTETPATVKSLMEQRLRWSLGMMQSGWKHQGAIIERRKLGLLALPDLAIFGYLMPLFAPLADLFLMILAVKFFSDYGTGSLDMAGLLHNPLVLAYLALPILEIITVMVAFRLDPKENRRLMLLIPLQRVFYRQLLYISVIRALWRAATGTLAKWGNATRVGYQFDEVQRS
jgi:cellulose synthase/poly-beta-1,6-N-acetylglucosamine synthase-like glycosyltransferase/peptidoglycan/xylan/chitin deacetylase (PgdA/CDA1 family)